MLKYIFKKSLEENIGESCYQVSKLTIKFKPLSRVTLACHYYSTLIEQSSVDEVISLQLIKINEKKKKRNWENKQTNKVVLKIHKHCRNLQHDATTIQLEKEGLSNKCTGTTG